MEFFKNALSEVKKDLTDRVNDIKDAVNNPVKYLTNFKDKQIKIFKDTWSALKNIF